MTEATADHFGVTVADLDTMVEFYRDRLGLDTIDRFVVSGPGLSDAVNVENATGRFAHLDADGVRLELVEYDPAEDGRSAGIVNRPGTTHLGLAIDDIDAVYADLDGDVTTLSEPRTTESGTRILFLRDPEGNLVELLEA